MNRRRFRCEAGKPRVEKHFGGMATGKAITRPKPGTPKMNGEMRKIYKDDVRLLRLYMVWDQITRMRKATRSSKISTKSERQKSRAHECFALLFLL